MLLLLAGLPLTLLVSYASYRFLERPMMNAGARLAARISADRQVSP
jgi:peptidoglycan/LPS O-acetylase OafA/YrhL